MSRTSTAALPILAAVGAVITIIAAFGAWGSVSADQIGLSVSASGWDGGDGKLTAVLAILAGAAAFMTTKSPARWQAFALLAAGALIAIVAIYNMTSIGDDVPASAGVDVSISWGLYATLLGGVLIAAEGGRRLRG